MKKRNRVQKGLYEILTQHTKSAEYIVYLSNIYRVSIVYLSCIYRVWGLQKCFGRAARRVQKGFHLRGMVPYLRRCYEGVY